MSKGYIFWSSLLGYCLISIYLLNITLSTPFLDIKLKNYEGDWLIENLTYSDWSDKKNIEEQDTIAKIDNIEVHEIERLQYDPYIRGAKELLIINKYGEFQKIKVQHRDSLRQFYFQFIIPIVYFTLTIISSIYLYSRKNISEFIGMVILFNFSIAIGYISSGASARGNLIGVLINSSFLMLSGVLLLVFLIKYFSNLGVKIQFIKYYYFLYIIPIFGVLIRIIEYYKVEFKPLVNLLLLTTFLILIIAILILLGYSYFIYNFKQARTYFIGLIFPFFPFVFLFVIPEILTDSPFLGADICLVFLLLIPINLTILQLTERLFNIPYYISRLSYYLIISIMFAIWLIMGFKFIVGETLTNFLLIMLFINISTIILLYIKEKSDYIYQKVLFPYRGEYLKNLYTSINKLRKGRSIEDIISIFKNEIKSNLAVKNVNVVQYDNQKKEFCYIDEEKVISVNTINIEKLNLGELKTNKKIYMSLIHENIDFKLILIIELKNRKHLKIEEIIWLELIVNYLNGLIESIEKIESLLKEMKKQGIAEKMPIWMRKLLLLKIEEEKFKIAQEIHDLFLQDYIYIIRQLDLVLDEGESQVKPMIKTIYKEMLSVSDSLRDYCETLKPPLLNSLGLNSALENLTKKISDRAEFVLDVHLDRLYLNNDQLPLAIYRIVQELLNNAVKHSAATIVKLSLIERQAGIIILYEDNGKGFNMEVIRNKETLGILGIKEQVEAFGGNIKFIATEKKGTKVVISISDGDE